MEHKEFTDINVIPLVDIMLVLLTIALTTATFIVTGEIGVNLPEAKNTAAASADPVVVTLTKDEKLFISGQEMNDHEVLLYFSQIGNGYPVVIRADSDVPVRRFAFVLDMLKGEGFRKVSMEVKDK